MIKWCSGVKERGKDAAVEVNGNEMVKWDR